MRGKVCRNGRDPRPVRLAEAPGGQRAPGREDRQREAEQDGEQGRLGAELAARLAAGSDSEVGRRAGSALVRLDLPRNPGGYVQVEPLADKAGNLALGGIFLADYTIRNFAPVVVAAPPVFVVRPRPPVVVMAPPVRVCPPPVVVCPPPVVVRPAPPCGPGFRVGVSVGW